MPSFSTLDVVAFLWFTVVWFGQGWLTEFSPWSEHTVNHFINEARRSWIRQAAARELRMVDTGIVAGLQNGTAFFASTSLIAIGGGFTLLNSADHLTDVVSAISLFADTDRVMFEYKVIGLLGIYAYAFFKFGWAYRMFNFASILIGALPPADRLGSAEADRAIGRTADIVVVAGKNFNRGLRAFFMSIGFLGAFVGPWVLIASSTFIGLVLARRQFFSDSSAAMRANP
jgi:uncharacterized membrane protein